MPNWVYNDVKVKKEETIRRYLTEQEDGSVDFDFNKVIEMPEELNIEDGSSSYDALVVYLTSKLQKETSDDMRKWYDKTVGNPFCVGDLDQHRERLEASMKEHPDIYTSDKIDELYKLGKTLVDNRTKYGASTWYYWRLQNWGVKWNAGDTQLYDDTAVAFETPWDIPRKIFIEMSKQNPDEVIEVLSEEETGWWVRAKYVNGKMAILEEGEGGYDTEEEDDD